MAEYERHTTEHLEKPDILIASLSKAAAVHMTDKLTDSILDIDNDAFPKIAYPREYIRDKVISSHWNMWFACDVSPGVGNPFDVDNMHGYILSSDGYQSEHYQVSPGVAYIESIGVRPESHRRGIGKRLLNTVCWQRFVVERLQEVRMTVRRNNLPMRTLVAGLGGEEVRLLGSNLQTDNELRDEWKLEQGIWTIKTQISAD